MSGSDSLQYIGKKVDGRHVFRVRPYVGTPRRRATANFDMPTASLKAARRRARDVVRQLEEDADLVDVRRPTINQLLDDWINRGVGTKSPRTLYGYRQRADKIGARFGTVRAAELTPDMVDAWYHDMQTAGVSNAERLEIHRVLSAVLRWAVKMRRIPEAVTEFVDRPRHTSPSINPPKPEMMRRLMTGLPDAEWARAIALLAFTGMRRGEVCGLRWEDIDGPTIWVRHSVIEVPGGPQQVQPFPKSREHRRVGLHAAAVAVLEQQRAYVVAATRAPVVWVFPDWASWRYRLPRRPSSVNRAWGRYRRKHGADSVRPHDLRHFNATYALAAGAKAHDVAKQLGHKDVATTIRIYGHGTDEGQQLAIDGPAVALGFGMPPTERKETT